MGVRVRVGDFASQADANAVATTLTSDGFAPLVEWSGFDPQPGPDAELLHVAIVDPRRFAGQVIAYHGSAIASKETVPDASAALNSVAATNGGFFTIDAPLAAVNGVNTGLSVYNGQIESLANGDRAALVLDGRRPAEIENLTSLATLSSGGSSIRILGINRLPGSAEDCGVAVVDPSSSLFRVGFLLAPAKSLSASSARMEVGDGCDQADRGVRDGSGGARADRVGGGGGVEGCGDRRAGGVLGGDGGEVARTLRGEGDGRVAGRAAVGGAVDARPGDAGVVDREGVHPPGGDRARRSAGALEL
jgi:hypothetical protein